MFRGSQARRICCLRTGLPSNKMAKFCGKIGYAEAVETTHGIWQGRTTERACTGELLRNTRRLQGSDRVNSDITIANEISIIADTYANGNFHAMRYITFMGSKWRIESVEVQYPRLILSIGGIYNGETAEDSDDKA